VFDREIDGAISQLIEQWDIAERRIKKAEFVTANQVVSSAIFDLRYAGRKLIDAHKLLSTDKWKDDPEEKSRILAFLADATEDCVKSKHDAIDAMMLLCRRGLRGQKEGSAYQESRSSFLTTSGPPGE